MNEYITASFQKTLQLQFDLMSQQKHWSIAKHESAKNQ